MITPQRIARLPHLLAALTLITLPFNTTAQADFPSLERDYPAAIRPILDKYCFECHSGNEPEADINLESFQTLADIRKSPPTWERVEEMLATRQMPPRKSDQPADTEHDSLHRWVQGFLSAEAQARAGDPGRVTLRRLSNSEYTYTIRDLTGVHSLDPAREFPVDGAAGEGFSNTGDALVMSPALVTKYLDAAKSIAAHAVFLPDGIRFSPHTTRRDWTDQWLGDIRRFYDTYCAPGGGHTITLQGLQFNTDQGGLLPLEAYLKATLVHRKALSDGTTSIKTVAQTQDLNPKYLRTLWTALSTDKNQASPFLTPIQARWQSTKPEDTATLVNEIKPWQTALWKYNVIGHIGSEGAATSWLEPVSPVASQQEFRVKLPDSTGNQDILIHLAAADAGDGNEHDFVEWKNARLEGGGSAVPLWAVGGLQKQIELTSSQTLQRTLAYLSAAASAKHDDNLNALAQQHELDPNTLRAWMDYLAIGYTGPVTVTGLYTETMTKSGNYEFVKGWGTPATPSIVANSSDQQVRIPGISRPHSVVVHPSPTLFTAAGWRSPISGTVQIEARISDAHPECGNGVEWFVQHQSGQQVGNVWQGDFEKGGSATMPPKTISVRKNELVTFIVGPRKGQHSCDLTHIDFTITETTGDKRAWDLAKDVSPDLLLANPHPDSHGNDAVWHFYKGEMSQINKTRKQINSVPAGSLMARWLTDTNNRPTLANQIKSLVTGPPPTDNESPDALLYHQLHRLATPTELSDIYDNIEKDPRFGKYPDGTPAQPDQLISRAPSVTTFHIPAALARDRTFVVTAHPDPTRGSEATVQLQVTTSKPDINRLSPNNPIIVADNSPARQRIEAALKVFRELFPPNLCYYRIVPIDEVVTLTLFYREDDQLQRLMLDDAETARLNRLWDEFFFISQEPLAKVSAFEQISEFATQDAPAKVIAFKPMKPVIERNAAEFRQKLLDSEPAQLDSVLEFADRAWRRPLTTQERAELRALYSSLRQRDLPHDESARVVLTRVLTSPAFLYRLEQPGPDQTATPVTNLELATRLSYFLWSAPPDTALRQVAQSGDLARDSVLVDQARRMLKDDRIRRLAVEFACQWLHIRNFDQNDEKNEKLYPQFANLRHDMYEESVRFFEDMFRNDGSILDLINADHTFLNETLAAHYGIENITGPEWRRVANARKNQRGGVLSMATVLASLSGASRTSPILRGNWVYETLLGERIPKPPPNVPQLPPSVPEGLTARQLIERHTADPQCAKCHIRIDPYGFALEQFDAIGRLRPQPADTKTTLQNGKTIDGLTGLREYLLNDRRDDIVRQFCKKLLGYSLGRATQLSDRPLLEEMQGQLKANDYRFSVAVESIILSPQFRNIRGQQFTE